MTWLGNPLAEPPKPLCCCTQDGQPYCGDPECDIDFCTDCGEEYTDPCPRHESVSRP